MQYVRRSRRDGKISLFSDLIDGRYAATRVPKLEPRSAAPGAENTHFRKKFRNRPELGARAGTTRLVGRFGVSANRRARVAFVGRRLDRFGGLR